MKNGTKIAVAAGTVVVVTVATAVALSRGSGGQDGADAEQATSGMAGMEGIQETAGADGDMAGMDMGGTSTDGSVTLSGGDIGTFGITFGSVEVRPLATTVRAVGLVEFDETRMSYVAPKFGGWAERLHGDFTGQVVRAGQPLLEVYAPELVSAQEELLLAAEMLESVRGSRVDDVTEAAEELLAAARRRLQYWDVSEDQIERILETGEVTKTVTLHAPASGVVTEKNVFLGQAFEAGANLYMIADLSEVWVNAEVFESDVALVREGMPVEVTIQALPGETFTGRIEYVYLTVQDRTRSMRARVALSNPRERLKPGMYATVRATAELGDAITTPVSAVLHTGERAVAFVDMGGGTLMPHEVELGMRGGDFVEVRSGLEPGQRVVTSAQFLLDSESNLAEVMRAMMAQMNMSDMGGLEMPGMDMEGVEMPGSGTIRPDSAGGR